MKFFKRFTGDNHQLRGPNFKSARQYTVDLSGTQLTFPAPKQTVMMPGHLQRFEFDIFSPKELNHWGTNEQGFKIHTNGWRLTGEKKRSFGYVTVDIFVTKVDLGNNKASFFKSNDRKKWILIYAEDEWGETNKETIEHLEKQSKGQSHEGKLWIYPKKTEQLHMLKSLNAIYLSASLPGFGINSQYWVPIGTDYSLIFKFRLRSVDCDFYSPEHNFPEASENLVKAFMDNVTIKLSPEAEVQKQAAENLGND